GPKRRNTGEASPSGWIAEQTSCTNPGSVSSAERIPPPIVSAASCTSTGTPASARVIAAASPFGPEPITNARFTVAPREEDPGHGALSGRMVPSLPQGTAAADRARARFHGSSGRSGPGRAGRDPGPDHG